MGLNEEKAKGLGAAFAREDIERGVLSDLTEYASPRDMLAGVVDFALNRWKDEECEELGRSYFHELYVELGREEGRAGGDLTSPESLKAAVKEYWTVMFAEAVRLHALRHPSPPSPAS